MYFDHPPLLDDAAVIAEIQFSRKTTFKDKFEVAWNFRAPYIIESRDKLNKMVGNSIFWRREGNDEYITAKDKYYLSESIKAYTKSIAYAPVGSKELSLAYANRSAVLFKARLYEDCLLDIERSLKSGYLDKLKTKLFLRQSLCFKALKPNSELEQNVSMANAIHWLPNLIENNSTYDFTKEYTKMINELKEPRKIIKFIPEIKNDNAIIVGASDAIELKKTNDNNQHTVATRDIETGEFIYISEPFAATTSNKLRFTNCWHCDRQTWAAVPCDNCPNIIYCSDTCKKKAWNSYHNIECLVLEQLLEYDKMDTQKSLTVKLFLKTLNSVGSLIELKKKIDNIDSMKNKELIFTNGLLDVNTIDNFLHLDHFKATSPQCNFEYALAAVHIVTVLCQKTNILGKKMTLKDLIKNEDKEIIILGELILQYMMMVRLNSKFFKDTDLEKSVVLSNFMSPFVKLLKKSCDPNVILTYIGSHVEYYTCRPIKQGEPLYWSSVDPYHTSSKVVRVLALDRTTDDPVLCECKPCVENWLVMEFLPSYQSMIVLPTRIKRELNCMIPKLEALKNVIDFGDIKEVLKIKDTLNRMNDKFHQYITVTPCAELSLLYMALKAMSDRLHTTNIILE